VIFKVKNFLLLFLLMLPLANLPQLLNIGEDTGAIALSLIIIPLFLIWLVLEKKIYIPKIPYNKTLLLIVLLGSVLTFISIILNKIPLIEGIKVLVQFSIAKFIYLYLIIIIAEKVSFSQALRLLQLFSYIVLASLLLSIPLYYLNPVPEFVFYDGGTRFAGFHFELVNYSFVVLLCFFIHSYFKGFSKLKLLLLLCFLYLTARSNAFYPFVGIALFSAIAGYYNRLTIQKILIVFILFITPLIGIFLEYFSFLEVFALRGATSFSLEGSQLFIRLYPWALAMQHFINTFNFLPLGLGTLSISPYITDTENLFGGTGITAIIAEYGSISLLLLPFIYLFFSNILTNILIIKEANSRMCLCAMLLLSLTYICIQSGFFNLTTWTVCIILQTIALKYPKSNL